MTKPIHYVGRTVTLAIFAATLAYLSLSPPYVHLAPDTAVIKLSLTHAGNRKGECHTYTPAETAALPPNMRKPQSCPRGHQPVLVEMEIDGKTAYSENREPSGLSGDGGSRFYRTLTLPAGRHKMEFRLRESTRTEGFEFVRKEELDLPAGRVLVVDFVAERGGFLLE